MSWQFACVSNFVSIELIEYIFFCVRRTSETIVLSHDLTWLWFVATWLYVTYLLIWGALTSKSILAIAFFLSCCCCCCCILWHVGQLFNERQEKISKSPEKGQKKWNNVVADTCVNITSNHFINIFSQFDFIVRHECTQSNENLIS